MKTPRFTWPVEWRRDVRTFVAGGACGFLAGVVLVFASLSQANMIVAPWSRAVQVANTATVPPVVVAPVETKPTATTGRDEPPAVIAPEAGAHSIGPDPASPAELKDRDLLIPIEGVKPEQLTRQFSDDRGGGRKHEALDILAPRNTPVRATENGTIARLFQSKAGGITIYQFDPTGAFCYYYAHLERYADGLREGQQVAKGQVIGYVGTSGNAPKDTPHLHFAIFRLTDEKRWWEGTPIDPYDVLR